MDKETKREYARRYYEANREEIREKRNAYYREMPHCLKQAKKEYSKQYRAENKDKVNAYQRQWRKDNPELYAIQKLRSKAKRTPRILSNYWLPVESILPKLIPQGSLDGTEWSRSAEVLVLLNDGTIITGHYEHDDFVAYDYWVLADDGFLTESVTHWMPLPEKPEADE